MAPVRMDNVGMVVEDLDAAIAFFTELGLELEGRATVDGDWVDRIVGLQGVRSEIATLRVPDGHGKVELSHFLSPPAIDGGLRGVANALGMGRVMFAVDDIQEVFGRLQRLGARLVGDVVDYENIYRLCYVRGPEGVLIALAQELPG